MFISPGTGVHAPEATVVLASTGVPVHVLDPTAVNGYPTAQMDCATAEEARVATRTAFIISVGSFGVSTNSHLSPYTP